MVQDQFQAKTTFLTVAYDGSIDCDLTRFHQFYLVMSFYDETILNITQNDGTTFELELPAFGTFAQKTRDRDDDLGKGTYINSNKAINVISGNLCTKNLVDGTSGPAGTYVTNIPGVVTLGQEYIVPRITNEDANPPGFSVIVVATEDGTTVESDGDMQTLNQSETAIFEFQYLSRSVLVKCSRNCLVTQCAKAISGQSGLIMQNIIPEHEFSTSAYFTTLDIYPTAFLSLVVKGESPVDGLYLNGDSLGNLTWSRANGYSTADMEIPSGIYELEAQDGRPFAAYIYFHLKDEVGGAGYVMLPTYSTGVSTTPSATTTTTPAPPTNSTFPQHTARVNGTAFMEDGQEMTPACALVRQ